MVRHPSQRRSKVVLAAVFLVAFAALPLGMVAARPGVDVDAFVCKVEVDSRLAETLEGKLEFLLVRGVDGRPPADRFVITMDHGYTAGVDNAPTSAPAYAPGRTFWLQGSPMGKDTYYGEQYLFFGYPQLYVSQVKSGLLWPGQVERLKSLYLSPFTALGFGLPGVGISVHGGILPGFLAPHDGPVLLLCVAVAIAAYRRKRDSRWMPGLIWVVGVYALLAIALAVPSL